MKKPRVTFYLDGRTGDLTVDSHHGRLDAVRGDAVRPETVRLHEWACVARLKASDKTLKQHSFIIKKLSGKK